METAYNCVGDHPNSNCKAKKTRQFINCATDINVTGVTPRRKKQKKLYKNKKKLFTKKNSI